MGPFYEQELAAALEVTAAAIRGCERAQQKFQPGSSQHSLLRNRIRALYTAQALLSGAPAEEADLRAALAPVSSIIHKCEAALSHASGGTRTRLERIIRAMQISGELITDELKKINGGTQS